MSKEIFKDIPNYEGMYQVSNLGNVKSLERIVKNKNGFRVVKEKILKNTTTKLGYLVTGLSKKSKTKIIRIHILVAITFLNHKSCGYKLVVDHIDNDKLNNKLDNLQIITHRYNSSKDKINTLSKYTGVSYHIHNKKWIASIKINSKAKFLGYFINEYDAHLAYQKELNIINNENYKEKKM